jgi:hypothetical protein
VGFTDTERLIGDAGQLVHWRRTWQQQPCSKQAAAPVAALDVFQLQQRQTTPCLRQL